MHALGIGTATAVFEGCRAIVLVGHPVSDPGRLVLLSLHGEAGGRVSLTLPEIDALQLRSRVVDFGFVTSGFFDVLGVRLALAASFRGSAK